jgi:hypothetical protein
VNGRSRVLDMVMVVVGVAFFIIAVIFVEACENM